MTPRPRLALFALLIAGCVVGCGPSSNTPIRSAPDNLTGQWREQVQFESGGFAAVHDLEFMLVFNAGGTVTESSNYDGMPPVPPAYGMWRRTGPRQYEAKYEFYSTKAPADLAEITKGGGWAPSGRGVITETITLGQDVGKYTSTITYEAFDVAGKPVAGGGKATGRGTRLEF